MLKTGLVSANKTSSPILFVGTTNDPVAPLRSAKKMSSQFCGSAVLAVDGTGVSHFSSQCGPTGKSDVFPALLLFGTFSLRLEAHPNLPNRYLAPTPRHAVQS